MAVAIDQLIRDAECVFVCVPPGFILPAQVASLMQPTITQTSVVAQITGTPVLVLVANPKRRRAIIQNRGNGSPFIGPANVTSSTGWQLSTVNTENGQVEVFTQSELYILGTTGQNVNVIEFLVP